MKRIRRSAVLTAGLLGLLTAVGLAFFIGSFAAEGTHTGTAGSGGAGKLTLPVVVNFPNGELTPTHQVALTAEVENTATKTVTFGGINPTITTGAAGCKAEWFHVIATGTKGTKWNEVLAGTMPIAATYGPGTSPLVTDAGTQLMLQLEETGTNQSACEGAPITVTLKLNE